MVNQDFQVKVLQISRSVKRISLQRFIVSKILYEENEVTERDIIALYQNQIFLQEKALREKDFSSKFGNSLEELSKILKKINLSDGLFKKSINLIGREVKLNLESFTIPLRNYGNFKTRFNGVYTLIYKKSEGTLLKDLKPVAYIGVGYKDKGSARKEHLDASPHWQDVARTVSNIQRMMEESLEKLLSDKTLSFGEKRKLQKTWISFNHTLERLTSPPGSQRSTKTDQDQGEIRELH